MVDVQAEPDPGDNIIRRTDRKRFFILEEQLKVSETCAKDDHVRRSQRLEIESGTASVHELQVLDEGRPGHVSLR
jgi:hypothetical protein